MPQVTVDVPQAILNMVRKNDISLEELLRLGETAFEGLPKPVTIEVPQDVLDFLEEYDASYVEVLKSGIQYIRWKKALDQFDRAAIVIDPDDASPRTGLSFDVPKDCRDFVAENDLDLAGVFYRGYMVLSEEIPGEETQRAMDRLEDECHPAQSIEDVFTRLGLDKW
jgi:hypothetical protein